MNRKLVKNLLLSLFVLMMMITPLMVLADPDPSCDPLDPACPIDGGLSALLVLGAGYGIKKVRDARKAKNNA